MGSWSVEWEHRPKLRNPVLVEGLPGVGNVAKLTVDYLVEQLKARPCCTFFSHALPSSVFINENNLIELPTIKLFFKRSKRQDLLFLCGDTQPADEASCYKFSDAVLSVASELGCKEVITLGGIALKKIPLSPQVFCTGTASAHVRKYVDMGISNQLYGVVGPIVGVSGVMTGLASRHGMDAVSLLAETHGHPTYLGVPGAAELLKVLKARFGLRLSLKHLLDSYDEIRESIAPAKPESANYIR